MSVSKLGPISDAIRDLGKERRQRAASGPIFTKQHYIAIANALYHSKASTTIIANLGALFQRDNPKFDYNEFILLAWNNTEVAAEESNLQ